MTTELQLAWEGLERGGWMRKRPTLPDAVSLKAFIDHEYGLHTPQALHELEVEQALEAAYVAGVQAGVEQARGAEKRWAENTAASESRTQFEMRAVRERQQAKLELAKAVSQAISAMASLVDEIGGIR